MICRSGSISTPLYQPNFSASACLKLGAPHVIAYWLNPLSKASFAASISGRGGSKSGNPCARLMPSCMLLTRVISLMTDSVNRLTRLEYRCLDVTLNLSLELHYTNSPVSVSLSRPIRQLPLLSPRHSGENLEIQSPCINRHSPVL